MGLVEQAGKLSERVGAGELTAEEGEDQLHELEEQFKEQDWQEDAGGGRAKHNSAEDLPPPPPLVSRSSRAGRSDMFQAAGIDLDEESALLTTVSMRAPAKLNPYRGGEAPEFCSEMAIRALAKATAKRYGLSQKVDSKVEELLAIAIEMRMTSVLQALAEATRVSQDDTHGLPVKLLDDPRANLSRLAAEEEVEQSQKSRQEQEELEALSKQGSEDARVKAMLDEQARQRSAAASADLAINMATRKKKRPAPKPRKSQPLEEVKGEAVRSAQAKQAEGHVLSPDEEHLLAEWDRRSAVVSRGRGRLDRVLGMPERTVGIKELLYVMETDPYFRSVSMTSALKSGFIGRGVVGESRVLIRE